MTKQKGPSERFKRKVLMRWRWLAERGVSVEQAALEIGVAMTDLRRWSRSDEVDAPLRLRGFSREFVDGPEYWGGRESSHEVRS